MFDTTHETCAIIILILNNGHFLGRFRNEDDFESVERNTKYHSPILQPKCTITAIYLYDISNN